MNTIGEILRRAREDKGKTLDDIAAATRINKKFLAEIEQGNILKLPETYRKAFIKAFAVEVGVDPNTLFGTQPAAQYGEKAPVPMPTDSTIDEQVNGNRQGKSNSVKGNPNLILLFVSTIGVIALIVMIVWMRSERNQKPVQEVSFSDVIREKETAHNSEPGPITIPDTSTRIGRDSLLLEGVTTDSEWVRVVSDTMKAKEYKLVTGGKGVWKAREYFILSVGNARAITFRLNGKNVGLPTTSPIPLSNIKFSWSTLDTISMKSKLAQTATKDSSGKGSTSVREVRKKSTPAQSKKKSKPAPGTKPMTKTH